jgi:formylglycine-generating enzyme required for sulfatase activity
MDRYEVSNLEFKAFVDASGYAEAAYWQDLPFDADSGGWQPAVRRFVDLTGQPGPSTWQAGTYGDGTADHPVTGVSWFEATAYCRTAAVADGLSLVPRGESVRVLGVALGHRAGALRDALEPVRLGGLALRYLRHGR